MAGICGSGFNQQDTAYYRKSTQAVSGDGPAAAASSNPLCRTGGAGDDSGAHLARWREKLRQRTRAAAAVTTAEPSEVPPPPPQRRARDDDGDTWRKIERLMQRLAPQKRPQLTPDPAAGTSSLLSRLRPRRRRAEPACQPANHAFEFRAAPPAEDPQRRVWWPQQQDRDQEPWVQSPVYEPLLAWPTTEAAPAVEVCVDAEGAYSVPVITPSSVPLTRAELSRKARSRSPVYEYPHLLRTGGNGECSCHANGLRREGVCSSSSPEHDYAVPVSPTSKQPDMTELWNQTLPAPLHGNRNHPSQALYQNRDIPQSNALDSSISEYSKILKPHSDLWTRPPSPPSLPETTDRSGRRPASPTADLWQRPKSPQTIPRSHLRYTPNESRHAWCPRLDRPLIEERTTPASISQAADPPASLPTSRRRGGRRRRTAQAEVAQSDSDEEPAAAAKVRTRRRPRGRLRRSNSMDSGHCSSGGRARRDGQPANPLGVDSGHGSGSIGSQKGTPHTRTAERRRGQPEQRQQRQHGEGSPSVIPPTSGGANSQSDILNVSPFSPPEGANVVDRICSYSMPASEIQEQTSLNKSQSFIVPNCLPPNEDFSKNSSLFAMLMAPVQTEIDSIFRQVSGDAFDISQTQTSLSEHLSEERTPDTTFTGVDEKADIQNIISNVPESPHAAVVSSPDFNHPELVDELPKSPECSSPERSLAEISVKLRNLSAGPPLTSGIANRISLPIVFPLARNTSCPSVVPTGLPPSPRVLPSAGHLSPRASGVLQRSPPLVPRGARRLSWDVDLLSKAGRQRSAELVSQKSRHRPESRRSMFVSNRALPSSRSRRLSAYHIRDTGVIIPASGSAQISTNITLESHRRDREPEPRAQTHSPSSRKPSGTSRHSKYPQLHHHGVLTSASAPELNVIRSGSFASDILTSSSGSSLLTCDPLIEVTTPPDEDCSAESQYSTDRNSYRKPDDFEHNTHAITDSQVGRNDHSNDEKLLSEAGHNAHEADDVKSVDKTGIENILSFLTDEVDKICANFSEPSDGENRAELDNSGDEDTSSQCESDNTANDTTEPEKTSNLFDDCDSENGSTDTESLVFAPARRHVEVDVEALEAAADCTRIVSSSAAASGVADAPVINTDAESSDSEVSGNLNVNCDDVRQSADFSLQFNGPESPIGNGEGTTQDVADTME